MTSDVIATIAAEAMQWDVARLAASMDRPSAREEERLEEWLAEDPDLWLYRQQTVRLLKKYSRVSVETGKLPSLLGREFFRSRVRSCHSATFEDAVILVHDVERSLAKLDPFSQKLIARLALQEYTRQETAEILGCALRTVSRRYQEALDRLSEIFLEGELIAELPAMANDVENACQEGEVVENNATSWEDYENIL